jgi:pseudouridine-5'-phosphate glycosidase
VIRVSETVRQALLEGCPIVALESSLIAHGPRCGRGSGGGQGALGARSGGAVILAVPPPPAVALSAADSAVEMQTALAHTETAGVRGREVTPYQLFQVADLTDGRSLAANRALLVNNARVAARLAAALAQTGGAAAARQSGSEQP